MSQEPDEPGIYLSAADRQSEYLNDVDPNSFKRNLITDILFQPGKIIIPDIFFYISRGIAELAKPDEESLIEVGVRRGIIVPAFRKETNSFAENLETILGKHGSNQVIQGVLMDTAPDVARRLDIAKSRAENFKPIIWPTNPNMGERYAKIVETYLSSDKTPEVPDWSEYRQDDLNHHWDSTEKWRTYCVREAKDATEKTAGSGLARGDLMNAVGHDVGISKDKKVDDITEIFRIAKPEKRKSLEYFFWWANSLYHYNQASAFRVSMNASYDPLRGAMVNSILPPSEATLHPPTFQDVAKIPPLYAFDKVRPDHLIDLRLGRAGYINKAKQWQKVPDGANERELRKSLKEYSKAVRDLVPVPVSDTLLKVFLGSYSAPTQVVASAALALTYLLAGQYYRQLMDTYALPLIAVGTFGCAVYQFARSQIGVKVPVNISSGISVDLNLTTCLD